MIISTIRNEPLTYTLCIHIFAYTNICIYFQHYYKRLIFSGKVSDGIRVNVWIKYEQNWRWTRDTESHARVSTRDKKQKTKQTKETHQRSRAHQTSDSKDRNTKLFGGWRSRGGEQGRCTHETGCRKMRLRNTQLVAHTRRGRLKAKTSVSRRTSPKLSASGRLSSVPCREKETYTRGPNAQQR